jgi:uncharacterized DUF497 family protein
MSLAFEWNDRKERTNLQKHGVDLVEATTVFSDPLARIFVDEGHSTDEPREIIIGHSSRTRLLLVCFTEPKKERIRVISARIATRREKRDYEQNVTS